MTLFGPSRRRANTPAGHDMHHVWRMFRLPKRFATELADNLDAAGSTPSCIS